MGDEVGGIAVHIGARVASPAGAGEVLVSRTVKDLVAGSGLRFADRGSQTLKGVPGDWQIYAVEREGPIRGCAGRAASSLYGCGSDYIIRRQGSPYSLERKLANWLHCDRVLDLRQHPRWNAPLTVDSLQVGNYRRCRAFRG